jgi:hypothetical protein
MRKTEKLALLLAERETSGFKISKKRARKGKQISCGSVSTRSRMSSVCSMDQGVSLSNFKFSSKLGQKQADLELKFYSYCTDNALTSKLAQSFKEIKRLEVEAGNLLGKRDRPEGV